MRLVPSSSPLVPAYRYMSGDRYALTQTSTTAPRYCHWQLKQTKGMSIRPKTHRKNDQSATKISRWYARRFRCAVLARTISRRPCWRRRNYLSREKNSSGVASVMEQFMSTYLYCSQEPLRLTFKLSFAFIVQDAESARFVFGFLLRACCFCGAHYAIQDL